MVCSMSGWSAGLALVMPQLLKGHRGDRGSTDSLTDHGMEPSSEADESFPLGLLASTVTCTDPQGSRPHPMEANLHPQGLISTSAQVVSTFHSSWDSGCRSPQFSDSITSTPPAPKTHYPAPRILTVSELVQFLTKNYQLNLDRSFFST